MEHLQKKDKPASVVVVVSGLVVVFVLGNRDWLSAKKKKSVEINYFFPKKKKNKTKD